MARHLTAAGSTPSASPTARPAWRGSGSSSSDVCVLDLMLLGIDGWRVIEQARGEAGIGTPIVVVSARGPSTTGSTRSSSAPTTTS